MFKTSKQQRLGYLVLWVVGGLVIPLFAQSGTVLAEALLAFYCGYGILVSAVRDRNPKAADMIEKVTIAISLGLLAKALKDRVMGTGQTMQPVPQPTRGQQHADAIADAIRRSMAP